MEIKPCPFCGSNNIAESIKISGRFENVNYHIQMYCKKCHTYGPRVLYKVGHWVPRYKIDEEEVKKLAIEKWNERK